MITRSIRTIAAEIVDDMKIASLKVGKSWRQKFVHAVPYIDAMFSLDKISDKYYCDSGAEIICSFLVNASTWRGDKAKEIKKELRAMVGLK